MKNIIFAIVIGAILFLPIASHASNPGAVIDALGHMKFAVTAEGKKVFDKDFKTDAQNAAMPSSLSLEYSQAYLKPMLGITEYFNVYGKLGTSKLDEAHMDFTDGTWTDFETDHELLYGLGIQVVHHVRNYEEYFIAITAEFSRWTADISNVNETGMTATNISGKLENDEFITSFCFGRIFDFEDQNISLTPYAGLVIDDSHTKSDGRVTYTAGGTDYDWYYGKHQNSNSMGVVAGLNASVWNDLNLGIEGHFNHEQSLTLGGAYKF